MLGQLSENLCRLEIWADVFILNVRYNAELTRRSTAIENTLAAIGRVE
jgi:hypothetical protein